MLCPNLYFNYRNAPDAPPDPFWRNQAINPAWPATPTPEVSEGVPITIPVQLQNRGDTAPPTRMRLFWSIPSTGFLPEADKQIGFNDFSSVEPHTDIPPADGLASYNFAWTPPAEASGHVCLRADAQMLAAPGGRCPQQMYGSDVPTDPLIAIRNIHVVEVPALNMAQAFAFAASNQLPHLAETRLSIRRLDPQQDRKELLQLVTDRSVRQRLGRGVKMGKHGELLFGLGRERRRVRLGRDGLVSKGCVHLERFGALTEAELPFVVERREKLATVKDLKVDLDLLPGELQQVVIGIPPVEEGNRAHVVDVAHMTTDGKVIGGLTVIFVTPPDYFAEGC